MGLSSGTPSISFFFTIAREAAAFGERVAADPQKGGASGHGCRRSPKALSSRKPPNEWATVALG